MVAQTAMKKLLRGDDAAWQEIRARIDSIANALFLVAGGALSVSMAVLLGKGAPEMSESAKCLVSLSWYFLLYSVIAFVLIKGILVIQAYKHHGDTAQGSVAQRNYVCELDSGNFGYRRICDWNGSSR